MRAVRLFAFLAWGTLALGACGGKTETGGETGGAGGGGAQAGSGGGGAGGAGAVAGTAGSGAFGGAMGGMGGMAAMGGMGAMGGMAATGGVGAFGGNGGGPGSIWAKAEKLCSVIASMPCPLQSCKQELGDAIDMAQSMGCTSELEAVFDCALAYPLYCQGGEPQLSPTCQKPALAFQDCVGVSPDCQGWGSSDGSCGVSCGFYGASCKPIPGGLQCVCEGGSSAGKMFKLPGTCNSPGFENAVAQNCN